MCCRLERVNIKKVRDVAKVTGTVITVAGAMVMTLYKGPFLDIIRSHRATHHKAGSEATNQHWIVGTQLLLGSCCDWAGFFILQVSIYTCRKIFSPQFRIWG